MCMFLLLEKTVYLAIAWRFFYRDLYNCLPDKKHAVDDSLNMYGVNSFVFTSRRWGLVWAFSHTALICAGAGTVKDCRS